MSLRKPGCQNRYPSVELPQRLWRLLQPGKALVELRTIVSASPLRQWARQAVMRFRVWSTTQMTTLFH